MKPLAIALLITALTGLHAVEPSTVEPPSVTQVWADYDPNKGDFKEEIVKEETKNGTYYRESYISAYVVGEEIRIYCQYKVKAGAQDAPGLLSVHGWMGAPHIDNAYVTDGWAVMTYDYCGKSGQHAQFTKYPEKLSHCDMDKQFGIAIHSTLHDGKSITDPKQTSDYVWYAMERRVLSYLEQQREVDKARLGAKGYSYGGSLMWPLAGTDRRIKAAVAYFGIGWLEYYRNKQVWLYNNPAVEPQMSPGEKIYLVGISPEAYVPHITAPMLFLNGSNDHHGQFERGLESFKLFMKGVPWAFAVQVRGHHNTDKIEQDCKMWLEKYVLNKEVFWPAHPKSAIKLDAEGVPELMVTPASPERVKRVEMYYAQKNPVCFTRSWRDIACVTNGHVWVGKMPVLNTNDYVFGYANIIYDTTVVLSTDFNAVIPSKLGSARATDKASDVIYSGDGGVGAWSNIAEVEGVGGIKGFRCTDNNAGAGTELMGDPKWKAPPNAQLGFKFYCTEPQTLILTADDCDGEIEITASDKWQELVIPAKRLIKRSKQKPMANWESVGQLRLKPKSGSDITRVLFAQFKWVTPRPGGHAGPQPNP